MDGSSGALRLFSPLIREWFEGRFGEPTGVQASAWPPIAAGEHVLLTAGTGSGKTLAAFLWALDRLATGAWSTGATRVVYVSPLRALGNDVRRNLLEPLDELKALGERRGVALPEIRVMTRTGDTPETERRRMRKHPPEILVTTPESLNVLVSAAGHRPMLETVRCVILDEIHAVAGNKRGTHLITAVERLVPLAGELQRIALSATVAPVQRVARFVGGRRCVAPSASPSFEERAVRVVAADDEHRLELRVERPAGLPDEPEPGAFWPALADEVENGIASSASTLVFTASRRAAEKATRLINEASDAPVAFAHHGSLSREVRLAVEERMKRGELPAIVATSSLELGIDVGSIERVVLVETPLSVSSALQRIGRAGHRVGETSRAVLYPSHPRDLMRAAVVARGVLAREVEEIAPPRQPLDVLAQIVVAMASVEEWRVDDLLAFLRCCDPYAELSERALEDVLEMLAGYHGGERVREVPARIFYDRVERRVRARPGAQRVVFLAGGTIADRGSFELRLRGSESVIGTLDEEFVWERKTGETFTLGNRAWTIHAITRDRVEVAPGAEAAERARILPFWRADEIGLGRGIGARMAELAAEWDELLDAGRLSERLEADHAFSPRAARELDRFLREQREATGVPLPHARHVVVETTAGAGGPGDVAVVLHGMRGKGVHRPLAHALEALWRRREGGALATISDEVGVLAALPESTDVGELLDTLLRTPLEALLRERVGETGLFGTRFREATSTALLLPRRAFRGRTPLWLHRERAKRLLERVAPLERFPAVVEAWRACLADDFDLAGLRALLDGIRDGTVRVSFCTTPAPSPLARELAWQRTDASMYQDDRPHVAPEPPGISVVREAALDDAWRPRLPRSVARRFDERARRVAPGYAPVERDDLLAFVLEAVALDAGELDELVAASRRDGGAVDVDEALDARMDELRLADDATPLFAPLERAAPLRSAAGDAGALAPLLAEWLRVRGLVSVATIEGRFGAAAREALRRLEERELVVVGTLALDTDAPLAADRENLEAMLRMARADRRPAFRPIPLRRWAAFVAQRQGLVDRARDRRGLEARLEALFGVPARAEIWETEILPARVEGYATAWLDELFASTHLIWLGCGPRRITLCLEDELPVFGGPPASIDELPPELRGAANKLLDAWPEKTPVTLETLAARTGRGTGELTETLWKLAFAGIVTNDTFVAVRRAAARRFREPAPEREPPRPGRRRRPVYGGRRAFDRWRTARAFEGAWRRLAGFDAGDALDELELARDRARQLLDRYGIVFREVLLRELPALRWGAVFRALRVMELAGEIVGGELVEGVPGVHFARPETLAEIEGAGTFEGSARMAAADPASPCGLPFELWAGVDLPGRIAGAHLVLDGDELVAITRRHGKEVHLAITPGDARVDGLARLARDLLAREVSPRRIFEIETIDGAPALGSPWEGPLRELGFSRGARGLELFPRH